MIQVCWYFTETWEQYRILGRVDMIDASNSDPDKLKVIPANLYHFMCISFTYSCQVPEFVFVFQVIYLGLSPPVSKLSASLSSSDFKLS